MTNYFDSLTAAVQHVQDWELPSDLLPLVIASEAALLCGYEAGHRAHAAWQE